MKKILAIYAGSFNPFTIGHKNITEKIVNIFGKENVLIAIGINPSKLSNLDEMINRAEYIQSKIGVNVEVYSTFLHELVEKKESEGYNVIYVRGLRNGDDLSYEDNQIRFIKDFKPDIKVIFIRCDEKFEHISSSDIKGLESFREGSSKRYLV